MSRCVKAAKGCEQVYTDAAKGAQDDKRLISCAAQRGLVASMWLQAAQEKDLKKAISLREAAVGNYRIRSERSRR